ncbi:MAG: hypothetical protein ACO2Y5_02805 [Nitrosopumilaceae archaeon]
MKNVKWSNRKIVGIPIIMSFLIIFVVSFVIYPDVGEKILYGKHPPDKKSVHLEYSEIIVSEKYDCMESASLEAKGDLSTFVKKFNECNK